VEIVALEPMHLDAAAHLFAQSYRAERVQVPVLPERHEDPSGLLPRLTGLCRHAPGVAALREGRLCGYLIGMSIPSFKGTARGAYVPIWGHAAAVDGRAAIYQRMYAHLSRLWVESGHLTQAITVYAQDRETTEVWFRNCFGLLGVDALRTLDSLSGADCSALEIRPAGPEDVDVILPLAHGLGRYLAEAPIFLPFLEPPSRAAYMEWLEEPAHTLWLALQDGNPVAYMRSEPTPSDVALVVSDPRTISITGAYTRPEWRGRQIAEALLGQIIDWARVHGYARCSVDFEAQNILGSRFWLRHFQPVCHSLIRRVDERIVGTGML
jgi:GNAT superfamily N-acetyltransferase